MPQDSGNWYYNSNSILPTFTVSDNLTYGTTTNVLIYPNTSTTVYPPEVLNAGRLPETPESNVDWLRRRVSEITDLVAA